jgi:hypothetical protein
MAGRLATVHTEIHESPHAICHIRVRNVRFDRPKDTCSPMRSKEGIFFIRNAKQNRKSLEIFAYYK